MIYEIKRVIGEPRPWNSQKGGPMLAYKIDAEADGKVAMGIEWSRKQTSRPPEVGEELVAHLEPGPFEGAPERLKVDYAATKELSGGSTYQGGGSKGGKRWETESQRDPERSARILRQHSQEMAIRFLTSEIGGKVPGDIETAEASLRHWTDWFDADVNRAGQAAKEGASAPASRSDAAVPTAVNRTPSPSQPATVDLQECHEALDTAGLTSGVGQAQVAKYMAFELDPERCVKAIGNLTNAADLETQGATLKALKENTEKWTGKPLPTNEKVDFDGIPF